MNSEEEEEPHLNRALRRGPRRDARPLTSTELRQMLKEEPNNVLIRISRDDEVLDRLLGNRTIDPVLVIRVISRSLDGTESLQREAVVKVIRTFALSNFIEKLENSLQNPDPITLKALLHVMKLSLLTLPDRAQRAFYYVYGHFLQTLVINDPEIHKLLNEVDDLMRRSHPRARRHEEEQRENEMRQRDYDAEPGEFRALSVIPTAADFDAQRDLEYRANKIHGAFENVNDYLDIQFRLLRADLILPLRDSILEFQAQGGEEHKHYYKAFKVYSQVRIVRPVCHDKGLCFRLSFDVSKMRINWSVSQRLKYGSLLCLSTDNFQTYRCAVVENRDPKDLERGLVDVQFIFQTEGPAFQQGRHEEFMALLEENRSLRYVMVESPTYFEAYKHVLQSLQNTTEDNFPFWNYIGQCHTRVDPPQYLQNPGTTMDLQPLIDTDFRIKDEPDPNSEFSDQAQVAASVNVVDPSAWPNRNLFHLDTSQFCAIQSALTREFALIQGPPGTGKTHLGILLMKVFLHNRRLWNEPDRQQPPILLVCYTNHALDQFLEAMLDFFDGKLIRVGSRSKSTKLEPYNLRSIRSRARENREVPMEIHLGKLEVRNKLKTAKAEIHLEAAKLEMLEREIVTAGFLKDVMRPNHYDSFKGESIKDWLGITNDMKKIEADGRKKAMKKKQREAQNKSGGGAGPAMGPQGEANEEEEEIEEEEEDEDDMDLFGAANREAIRNLDIDDDDEMEDNFDLFAEILGIDEQFENVRRANKLLEDVDKEIIKLQKTYIDFNISTFGVEKLNSDLTKDERNFQNSLMPCKKAYRKALLAELQKTDTFQEEMVSQLFNLKKLKKKDRWRLYRYWVDIQCRQLRGAIRDQSQEYERLARRYQEILYLEDCTILQKATIIGMTTTAAARYQAVLREIGPKIVLVEEAAEVLEGHVLASLSAQSQHVVLIGDQKQLRPNPSVHKLKTKCGLDISLFERLVNNNFPHEVLQYQHRMRPEISQLLKIPELYPELKDHDEVKDLPNIARVDGDVCFIHHEMFEEIEGETTTFTNEHEAKFVLGLFQYLVQQGYSSEKITILSPYAGQVHLIRQLLEHESKISKALKHSMKGVKVTSVDNYQGEENDIVILSLVRSNNDNTIGFLKENNRLCVALSRAKMGLYVIGNLIGLSNMNEMFKSIFNMARRSGFVHDHLKLLCTKHKGRITSVKSLEDFKKVPEGGCNLPCGARLNCGHVCAKICHTDDEKHTESQCHEKCRALCDVCGEYCKADHLCGKHVRCENPHEKVLPNCRHKQLVPCYMDPNQFECQGKCEVVLPCTHICGEKCGGRHEHTRDNCRTTVQVTSEDCGHTFQTECRLTQNAIQEACTQPCGTELDCEHICMGTCGMCSNGRLHINCQKQCKKLLICGHECKAQCSDCPPCQRPCENECQGHSKCMRKCGEPCASCVHPCSWSCKHISCPDLCCQPCERPPCNMPCGKKRTCGHMCSGLCGEKCPRLCTICPEDQEELKEINYGYDGDATTTFIELDCGHDIDVEFMDNWMATSTATDEESGQQAVELKTCPYCKTPVRKCNRYNKQIKEMLQLIERVKRKCIGEKKTIEELRGKREAIVGRIQGLDKNEVDCFIAKGNEVESVTIIEAQINQILCYQQLCALSRVAKECEMRWNQRGSTFRKIQAELKAFQRWALQTRSLYSAQNKKDAQREHGRLSTLLDLHRYQMNIQDQGIADKLTTQQKDDLFQYIKTLSVPKPAADEDIESGRKLCDELKAIVPISQIALTSEEKLQILEAMSLQKGAWYKCPKGHIYAIGECGRAMEQASCPECKETIGGTNHDLLPTNAWAPEMDDAEVPIWDNLQADRELADQLQREWNEQGFP